MTLLIRVEASPGSDIHTAAAEAIGLANRLQITVMFMFNSVDCMACPGDNPEKLANRQQALQDDDRIYKLARGGA